MYQNPNYRKWKIKPLTSSLVHCKMLQQNPKSMLALAPLLLLLQTLSFLSMPLCFLGVGKWKEKGKKMVL